LDARDFQRLVRWFISEESKHQAFAGVDPNMENWPQPVVLQTPANTNNTDEEEDPDVESTVEGTSYYFPSAYQPNSETGNCDTQEEFARSMMNGTTPTVLFSPGDYENERNVAIESIFPLVFPYGIGGFKMAIERRNPISMEALIDHYLTLSLPQCHRPDFVLCLYSMLVRIKTFRSGVIKCRTKARGGDLGERFSQLTCDEVSLAAARADCGLNAGGDGGRFLSAVSTSCKPLGHSNEAASFARKQYMAYCDHFGMPSLFISVTPDDAMSIRIRMWASSGKCVYLPSLQWSDEECIVDLTLRERIRMTYPGICSLEFQSLMDFMWKFIIGWDHEKFQSRQGVFGVPTAACETDEEQGRKTLHSHWLVWIEHFNFVRSMCYHDDEQVRQEARSMLSNYVKEVMCASFGDKYKISHSCQDNLERTETAETIFEPLSDQTVRDARHRDHCFAVSGKCHLSA